METSFIKDLIEKVFEHLSLDAHLDEITEINNGEIIKFSIKTEEPYLLIGENGKTLMAVNHLIKKMFENHQKKNNFKEISFLIDVNDYQEKRIQDIKNKAQIMAERARFFKSNVELMPMNPYERMIIHSFFSNAPDLETESTGTGRERRVVIKYRAD